MTRFRPKALVTAAVSGPGLDLLHQLADLVLDSWLDQPTLRIYNADAAGRAGGRGGRLHRDRRERRLRRRALRAAHHRRVQLPGRPHQRRRARRHGGRRAGAAGPRAQCRRGGRAGRGPALRRHPRRGPGRPRRPGGRDLPATGRSPTSATGPGSWPARRSGWWASGRSGSALRWRLRGLGMEVLAYDPYAPDATSSLDELLARADVISIHAPVTAETTGMIGADAFAKMRDGVVYLNTRGPRSTTPTRSSPRWRRARSPPPASTTSRASTWRPTTRSRRSPRSC